MFLLLKRFLQYILVIFSPIPSITLPRFTFIFPLLPNFVSFSKKIIK